MPCLSKIVFDYPSNAQLRGTNTMEGRMMLGTGKTGFLHDMKCRYFARFFVMAVSGLVAQALASDDPNTTLVVTTFQDSFELSVPVSNLTLVIPRGSLASAEEPRTGATASPRYFHFVDEKRGLVLTGWFESAASWSGFDKFWLGELSAMKNNGVSISKAPDVFAAGPWQAAAYDIDLPNRGTSENLRAELVRDGTWIDVHISVTSDRPHSADRAAAVELLKSMVVRERP
jgi:hypothetical protein